MDSSLALVDLSILRINFLRLLYRCEAISFHHLHSSSPLHHPSPLHHSPRRTRSFQRSVDYLRAHLSEFRRRRQVIQIGKENSIFIRRVAFLATLAEKEVQQQSPTQEQQIKQIGLRRHPYANVVLGAINGAPSSSSSSLSSFPTSTHPLAYGVHSIRSTSALLNGSTPSISSLPSSSSSAGSSFNLTTALSTGATVQSLESSVSMLSDESVDSLVDRSSPMVHVGQEEEIRRLLFAKHQQQTRQPQSSSPLSSSSLNEFSADLSQRRLMNDLHDMTDTLKSNALRLRSALATDSKILDSVDQQLDENLHSIKHENSRLSKWASTGCSEMCWNILLIVTVWAIFIAMFIFMKIFPAPK